MKRRASTDQSDSVDIENNNTTKDSSYTYRSTATYYVPTKRCRTNSVDSLDIDTEDSIKPTSCAMDTTQINSLVNIFSQSFSDFTSAESSDMNAAYETSTEMNTFALCRDSIALTA